MNPAEKEETKNRFRQNLNKSESNHSVTEIESQFTVESTQSSSSHSSWAEELDSLICTAPPVEDQSYTEEFEYESDTETEISSHESDAENIESVSEVDSGDGRTETEDEDEESRNSFHESDAESVESSAGVDGRDSRTETDDEDEDESSKSSSEYSQSTLIDDFEKQNTKFEIHSKIRNIFSLLQRKIEFAMPSAYGCAWDAILRLTKPSETDGVEYVSVLIRCDPLHSNQSWQITATATFTFRNFDGHADHVQTDHLKFTNDLPISGILKMIRWSGLENMGFCRNGEANLQICLADFKYLGCNRRKKRISYVDRSSVLNDWTFPPDSHDERKHISTKILSLISPKFENIFEADKPDDILNDAELLRNVYAFRTEISEHNIFKLTSIATRYQVWSLLKECIDYLSSPRCRCPYDTRLVIANSNSLNTLEAIVIDEILNGPGIEAALGSSIHYDQFSPFVKSLIAHSQSLYM